MDKINFENYTDQITKPTMVTQNAVENQLDNEDVWKIVSENIRMVIDKVEYQSWFGDTFLEDINNGVASISCSSDFKKSTILRDYNKVLQQCLLKATGQNLQLEISIRKSESKEPKSKYEFVQRESLNQNIDLFSTAEREQKQKDDALKSAKLNPKYLLDNFIVGNHNKLAEAVALAVVDSLGKAYNPVFYYGSTGVGKTHLMQAIGNEILNKDSKKKVVYVSIEQFLNEMIEAIRTKRNEDFRSRYREVDLLIIDDVQFVEAYPKTQEELFHTFNTLYQANKQIILASDRPPKEIKNITDRLRTRFQGGMVVDIQMPDYETRMAILKQSMIEKGISNIPEEYLELIAQNIDTSVRELEGCFNKVVTLIKLGEMPSYEDVARILQVDIDSKRKRITPVKVLKVVSDTFDVPIRDIKGSRRTAYVALTRQVVMFLLRQELDLPLERVAKEVNRKDHTTVLHACEKITKRIESDSRFAERIENCKRELAQ
jgi:chromosomal replication initiator protein